MNLQTAKNLEAIATAEGELKASYRSTIVKHSHGGTRVVHESPVALESREKLARLAKSTVQSLCAVLDSGAPPQRALHPTEQEVISAVRALNALAEIPIVYYGSVNGITVKHGGQSLSGDSWGGNVSSPLYFDFYAENPVEAPGQMSMTVELPRVENIPLNGPLHDMLSYCARVIDSIR